MPDLSLVPDTNPRITSLEICLHSKHCKQNKRLACSSITGYLIRDGFSHGDNAHILICSRAELAVLPVTAAVGISAVVFFLRMRESAGAAAGEQNP